MLRTRIQSPLSVVVVLALTALAVVVASPRRAAAEEEFANRVVHGLMAGDIRNLDPALVWVSVESPIITMVMEGLVDYPPGNVSTEFVPGLAEKWELSPDGLTYTFHLRKNVPWQGGYGEFSAEDVKFSLDRHRDPDISAWVSEYSIIKNVEIIDPYTVKVELAHVDPFFLGKVATDAMNGSMMMCKKAFEEKGADHMRLNPIGTGPFQFKEYRSQERVVLSRFDNHWRGKAKLEEVVLVFMPNSNSREMALRTGEIDTMRVSSDARVIERLIKDGFILDTFGPENFWWLHIDTTQKPFDDIRVRKAVRHAINPAEGQILVGPIASKPETYLTATYFGAATKEELPPDTTGYDPEKAKALLKEAGYPDGFQIEMLITEREDYRQQMIIIQEQLRKVGIDVKLNVVDHTRYHSQIRTGVNPLVLYGEISYPNAEIALRRFFKAGVNSNFSKFNDPVFEELLDKVAKEQDMGKRREYLVQAQRIISENALMLPILFLKKPLIRSPRVDLGYQLKNSLVLNYRFLTNTTVKKK